MGIETPITQYERESLEKAGLGYDGLKWCELGNQRFGTESAKDIYLDHGVAQHISIDLNGKDGAIPLNLDDPVPFVFLGQFDVVTNYGTIEHVNQQYQVFKNTHDMCKRGGLMIHVFPRDGNWPGHCRYYYTEQFAGSLGDACGYETVTSGLLDRGVYERPHNLIAVSYRKTADAFISEERFNEIDGLVDTEDKTNTGNYTRRTIGRQIRKIRETLLGR